jgi:ribosomal protein S18 acetylase RimI-like enzyme
MRHPNHDEIVTAVSAWYRRSYPEMGYNVERRRYGWYSSNAASRTVGLVTVDDVSPDDVPTFLADVRAYFQSTIATLAVDDRMLDEQLGPVLMAAGCLRENATIYLAHVGELPEASVPQALEVVTCDETLLEEHAIAKRKGFANSEEDPLHAEVIEEMALRTAELAGNGRFAIARIGGEAASTIGWYSTDDAFIFDLATRVPYRHCGIATALIRHVLEAEYRDGARSVVINADEDGRPAQLYRRLGFTDEVYWRQAYRLQGAV